MLIRIFLFIFTIILIISLSISSFATEDDLDYLRLINEQKEFISAIKSNDISKIKSILALPKFEIPYEDENGDSPMIIAAREGNEETVKFFLNTNKYELSDIPHYNANFQNLNFETALIVAVKRNDTDIIKQFLQFYIISGADITLTDRNKKDALYYAEQNKNQEVVALLKKAITQQKLAEKLIESIANKDIKKAKELIKQGANVNFAPVDEIASVRLSNSLEAAAWSEQTEIVELIIKNGANIKMFGSYALHGAAETGNIDTAKLLLDTGVDINQKTGDYFTTPLLSALLRKQLEMAKFLLANGANPNIRNKFGYPLDFAIDILTPPADTEAIKMLIEAGADPNIILIKTVEKKNIELVKLLLINQANPNIQDFYGNTALMIAIKNQNNDIAKLLLEYKADPNIQNEYGETALSIAKNTNSKMIKVLIDGGAK